MADCIFCKIAKGEVPCEKIWEDEEVLAFLDIKPINPGHTLVIPKKHSETIRDIDEKTLMRIMKATKKVSCAVINSLAKEGFDGLNISVNNYASAGQIVPHFHVHLIPRKKDDGYKSWERKSDAPAIQNVAEKIRKAI